MSHPWVQPATLLNTSPDETCPNQQESQKDKNGGRKASGDQRPKSRTTKHGLRYRAMPWFGCGGHKHAVRTNNSDQGAARKFRCTSIDKLVAATATPDCCCAVLKAGRRSCQPAMSSTSSKPGISTARCWTDFPGSRHQILSLAPCQS